jgi:hypothetical protein
LSSEIVYPHKKQGITGLALGITLILPKSSKIEKLIKTMEMDVKKTKMPHL